MKHFFAILIVSLAALCARLNPFARGRMRLANAITISQEFVETHCDSIGNLKTDDALTARDLLFGPGSDASHVQINGAAELPIGTVDNKDLSAEDTVALLLLAGTKTRRMVCSEAVAAGVYAYTAAGGKVQDEPATAGTFYLVGVFMTAGLADGDTVEVLPLPVPIKVVVIALLGNINSEISAIALAAETSVNGVAAAAVPGALTSTNGVAAAAIPGALTSTNGTAAAASADLAALAAEAEKIGDDVRAVHAAMLLAQAENEKIGDDTRAIHAAALLAQAENEKIGDDVRDVRAKYTSVLAKLEELADDVRAIATANATPALLKVLAA